MERPPVDEEAPKDPGAHQVHQNFSEKDFDSKFIELCQFGWLFESIFDRYHKLNYSSSSFLFVHE